MQTVLDEILAHKRREIEQARHERPIDALRQMQAFALRPRNFFGAVTAPTKRRPNLIAEVKAASPSGGVIARNFDPVRTAVLFAEAGASALSVLTDKMFFRGSLGDIELVKRAVELPVLRKDFLLDAYQVYESRAYGADAVLLIAEALEPAMLTHLVSLANELDLAVLIEIHQRSSLLGVLKIPGLSAGNAVLLGINNRDLRTQLVDISTTEAIAPLMPPGIPFISESGVRTRNDVERLLQTGACALLVGETLMRSDDPGAAVRELFG